MVVLIKTCTHAKTQIHHEVNRTVGPPHERLNTAGQPAHGPGRAVRQDGLRKEIETPVCQDLGTDERLYRGEDQLGKLGIATHNNYISGGQFAEFDKPSQHHPQGIADAQNIIRLIPSYARYTNNMNSIPVFFLNRYFSFGIPAISVTGKNGHIPTAFR